MENTKSDQKRKISTNKGRSSSEESAHKLPQPKISKRARYRVESSSDAEYMSAASQFNWEDRELSLTADPESSGKPETP